MALKIVFIGAGSLGFTRALVHDLLAVPEFRDAEIVLHDINRRNLGMIEKILVRDVRANGLPTTITRSLDRRRALRTPTTSSTPRASAVPKLRDRHRLP